MYAHIFPTSSMEVKIRNKCKHVTIKSNFEFLDYYAV